MNLSSQNKTIRKIGFASLEGMRWVGCVYVGSGQLTAICVGMEKCWVEEDEWVFVMD